MIAANSGGRSRSPRYN
ncbi:hypothetical protein YPPY88_1183, partial [Yersinia pestis PY-88]